MSNWLGFSGLMIAGYLAGSIPSAYLVAKWFRGIDIRKVGSGNVGSSNVMRSASKWLAIPVILFDFGKGALVTWLAKEFGFPVLAQIVVGTAAVIGHNWPVFLNFQGGRGAATSLGVILVISPLLALILVPMAYALAPWHWTPISVFLAFAALPFMSWFLAQPLGIADRAEATIGFAMLTLLAYVRRLAVPRVELSRDVPQGELIMNRLFLDRDIRDWKAWLSRGKV
jgi:acyl phosphate:glycerol-3-phosphate acyltransferase